MSQIICTVSLSKGWLDNDFTIYEDGKIEHYYDKHETKTNITEIIEANQLDESLKIKIIDKSPEEYKDKIKKILFGK